MPMCGGHAQWLMLRYAVAGPAAGTQIVETLMVNLVTTLFREFLHICLFKKAPQDLPASGSLLGVTLVASTVASLIVARSGLPWGSAAQSAVAETLFMVAIIYLLVKIQGHPARWLQTVTAVAGTNIVLVVISLPLLVWLLSAQSAEADATVPALLFLGLIIWNVMILGHIFRHALSTYFPLGVLVALGYYSLSVIILNWLVPAPGSG